MEGKKEARASRKPLDKVGQFSEGFGVGKGLVQFVRDNPGSMPEALASAAKRMITHPSEMLGPTGAGLVAGVVAEMPDGQIKEVVNEALSSKPVARLVACILGGE